MEEEIDLKEIFQILKNKWKLIGIITLSFMIISVIISFFVLSPVYESSATVLVGQSQNNRTQVDYQDVQLSRQLVSTYGEIMKTSTILDQVIENENLDMNTDQLSQKITVSPVGDTEIMNITVSDRHPQQAANIANEISQVFHTKIQDIMKVDNVSVIEEAVPGDSPVKPNKMMNIAIATVLGLMIGVFVVFIQEYLDNTIKNSEDVAKYLDLPVLGSIPQMEE